MPAVSDLFGLWRSNFDGFGINDGTVAGNDFNFGMLCEPNL